MDIFQINNEAIKYAWRNNDEYWFSLKTFKLCDSYDLSGIEMDDKVSQTIHLLNMGIIPYVSVNNLEVMHAFVNTINDKKLKSALNEISDDIYVEQFWKYINIYPNLADEYSSFEDNYVVNKIISWCKEKGIKYEVNK